MSTGTLRGRYLPDGTLNIAARWKSPGPGKYLLPSCTGFKNHDFTIEKRPAYTIGERYKDLDKDENSPGPIYLPRSNVTNRGIVRSSSSFITSRPITSNSHPTPGPMDYNAEKYKQHSPAFTIGTKHKHLEIPTHPVGPNQYNLPCTIGNRNFQTSIKNAPKFSLSGRNKFMSITYGMDGSPSKLYYPSLRYVKADPPKWTMTGKHYLPEMEKSIPAPNAYNSNSRFTSISAPKFSMGIRHSEFCSTGFANKDDE